jgi:DNA replication licensing factor MCM4
MELIHNRCEYSDKQVCRLQETPDSIPDGQTPHTVSLCLYDDLVDASKPGDRLEVTGIFRSVPVRVNPRNTTVKSLFKTYLDVVHLKKTNSKRVEDHIDESIDIAKETSQSTGLGTFTETQVKEIEELSKDPNVYKILANSIAPSIFGMDDIKKGILLQLFGGTDKHFDTTSSPKARGDINILLVGDPGTSKSQLLQKAHHISPRGMYTSGKGSSAVGLTAYVTRDAETRQLVLESGALVLSDGGLCCIDEFDKMSDATRSILHEVMEQQTVSVAKAGIITTLNARTSILACANPIGSQWNRNLSVPENINLPPSLLSRFDLVYLILDKVEPDHDRHLAKHLVSLYLKDRPDLVSNTIPLPLLTRYVTYAKAAIKPVLNEEASREIVKAYVELRKAGQGNRNQSTRITATTRQLESMVRLSEAHAKVRLSNEVTKEDVFEACRLLREAIKASATDPTTGLIDWDILATGVGAQARVHLDSMKSELRKLISKFSQPIMRYNLVQETFKEQSSIEISTRDFARVIKELQGEGFLEVINENSPTRSIKRLAGREDNQF